MDPFSIIMLVLGIAGAATSIGLGIAGNKRNYQAVEDTNAANLQAVRETNATNVEQAELAYKRSLPVNQVNNLMAAGMSRSAALQSLSGSGSYSSPVLQSAHADAPQVDYSQVASAFERLGNIPSNTEQFRIQEQQLSDLKQQSDLRQQQELRAQEKHEFDMWRERYGQKTAELLDGVSSKVVQVAAEKNYDLSSAKSVQSIMHDLGLDKDKDYVDMPHLARLQLFDAIKSQNDQRIQQETHESNMKKAELERSIMDSNLKQMAEDYQNSVKEHKTQDKERLVREGRATLLQLLNEVDISEAELQRSISFVKDKNGNLIPTPAHNANAVIKKIWQTIGNVVGIDYFGDILKGIIKVGG